MGSTVRKNKAETCSLLDAIGRRSCGRWRVGIKIDVWENPVVYASTRDWSSLYGAIRSEPETAAKSSCSHFWTSLGTLMLSLFCMHRSGCSCCDASGEFCLPSLCVLSSAKKKKSVSPHDSLAVHPDRSERSPTLPSSSGLCVRQIENEQQSTVGEVSQRLKVMALARRPAGPDNAVPSLPGSDSWLSEKKQTKKFKSEACSCTSWCSQATF